MKKAHELLDFLIGQLSLKNDRQLAQLLQIGQPTISKIRSGVKVSAEVILAIHEATDIPVPEIKSRIPK